MFVLQYVNSILDTAIIKSPQIHTNAAAAEDDLFRWNTFFISASNWRMKKKDHFSSSVDSIALGLKFVPPPAFDFLHTD